MSRPILGSRRPRSWAWLFVAVAFAQACGGGSSRTTGPTPATTIAIRLTGLETALLPTNCTATLTVTGPGMAPLTATIPADGVLSLPVPAGSSRTFAVAVTCLKSNGPRTFTGQTSADVVAGQTLTLTIRVAVNEPPTVSASCSPSSVAPGVPSTCSCTGSDPDPGDTLSFTWSTTGGSISSTTGSSTQFQSSKAGTFTLTCAVSDGKFTRTATATVTVGPTPTPSTLSVGIAGTGSGSVSGAGISCPGTCTATFPSGTLVTLTATPGANSAFAGWTGACSGTGACTVTVTGAVAVTAIFNTTPPPPPVTLTLNKAGAGSGTVISSPPGINCGPICVIFSANFRAGTTVTLNASASGGSVFAGWSGGGCSGTGPCTLVLTGPTTVSATFN